MEFVASMLDIPVSASAYAQQKSEPGIAALNIEAASNLLSPGDEHGRGRYRADLERHALSCRKGHA